MKRNITLILITLCLAIGVVSCSEDSYPENPTLVSPISGLVLEVNGTDYVATPLLQEDGLLSKTLLVAVNQPSTTAIVKQIDVSDPSATVNINVGDVITFRNNQFALEWTKGTQAETFLLEMSYNPPPVMYLVMSGEKGDYYGLNTETAQTIASITYNNLFEGYIDLTETTAPRGSGLENAGLKYAVSGILNKHPETGEYGGAMAYGENSAADRKSVV